MKRIKKWKDLGYHISLYYLKLSHADLAVKRVEHRVLKGGHNVPEGDIRRRYEKNWENFIKYYQNLADRWIVIDNSDDPPVISEESK